MTINNTIFLYSIISMTFINWFFSILFYSIYDEDGSGFGIIGSLFVDLHKYLTR